MGMTMEEGALWSEGGVYHWIKQDWISNIRKLRHTHLSIIAISYIRLPGLQRKLSVCKQRGEEGERVVTPPLEGVVHRCS